MGIVRLGGGLIPITAACMALADGSPSDLSLMCAWPALSMSVTMRLTSQVSRGPLHSAVCAHSAPDLKSLSTTDTASVARLKVSSLICSPLSPVKL